MDIEKTRREAEEILALSTGLDLRAEIRNLSPILREEMKLRFEQLANHARAILDDLESTDAAD